MPVAAGADVVVGEGGDGPSTSVPVMKLFPFDWWSGGSAWQFVEFAGGIKDHRGEWAGAGCVELVEVCTPMCRVVTLPSADWVPKMPTRTTTLSAR